jgi:adenine-specific DNA methylase
LSEANRIFIRIMPSAGSASLSPSDFCASSPERLRRTRDRAGRPDEKSVKVHRVHRKIENVKLDVPDEFLPLIVTALENQCSFTRATQRDDGRFQEAAEWFKAHLPKQADEKPRRPRK